MKGKLVDKVDNYICMSIEEWQKARICDHAAQSERPEGRESPRDEISRRTIKCYMEVEAKDFDSWES